MRFSSGPCPPSLTDILHSDWDRIRSPAEDQIVPYAQLTQPNDVSSLNKLAVLKVNGGLGTSMGTDVLSCSPPLPLTLS